VGDGWNEPVCMDSQKHTRPGLRAECARQAGIANLAPHDLRRTCARLCHDCNGELEQIRFLLGHASVQTTERYIGSKQKLQDAVNDRFEILVAKYVP
jgi:integrase